MGFTTAAFIRHNTPELRKKLNELGYSHGKPECYTDDDDSKYNFIICYNEKFYLLSQKNHVIRNGHPLKKYGSIDCGTNEELFLAIAALRDDTDENQWFTNGEEWAYHPKTECCSPCNTVYRTLAFDSIPKDTNMGNYHKATVEELMEHFKEKEE